MAELSRKLQRKLFSIPDVNAVLSILATENLVNDARFTEEFIRYRRSKGYGPLRIRAELIERGITQDLIEHHLKILDNTWFDDAHRVRRKRFTNSLPHDFKSRAQQMRFLQYRGFTSEQINFIFHGDDET
jgi:regulatory protein